MLGVVLFLLELSLHDLAESLLKDLGSCETLFFRLGSSNDDLPSGENQCSRLWLSNLHYECGEPGRVVLGIPEPLVDLLKIELAVEVTCGDQVLQGRRF